MADLLEDLYYGKYCIRESMDEVFQGIKEEYKRYCTLADTVLDRVDGDLQEMVKELLDLRSELVVEENFRAYTHGVRFGVRLMTEALGKE